MSTEDHILSDDKTPSGTPCNYSPVTVELNENALGAIFLGILSICLLIGWMRSEARLHTLITRLEKNYGNPQLNS